MLIDSFQLLEKENQMRGQHAAEIERKDSLYLGLGVEEQAMLAFRRQLTPEAQKKADEKKLAAGKKNKSAAEKKAAAKKTPAKQSKDQPGQNKTKERNPGAVVKIETNKTSPRGSKDQTEYKQFSQHQNEAKPKKADNDSAEEQPSSEEKRAKMIIRQQSTTEAQKKADEKTLAAEKKVTAKKDPARESKDQPNQKKRRGKSPGAAVKKGANTPRFERPNRKKTIFTAQR